MKVEFYDQLCTIGSIVVDANGTRWTVKSAVIGVEMRHDGLSPAQSRLFFLDTKSGDEIVFLLGSVVQPALSSLECRLVE